MKFLKMILLVVAILPFSLNATEVMTPPVDNILIQETTEAKKLKIGFQFFKDTKVTVQVKDITGYTLYREVVKSQDQYNMEWASRFDPAVYPKVVKNQDQYSKQFDFINIPNGEYVIILKDKIKEVIQPFVIEADKIKVLDELQKIIFNPSVRVQDDRLMVGLLMGAPATVELQLSENRTGREVLSETIEDNFRIHRIYNTRKLAPGVYTLKIQTSFKTILKYIRI